MKVALLLVLVGSMAGCVSNVDKVLDAAARAENRIGKSGADALEGIAFLSSSLTSTSDHLGAAIAHLDSAIASLNSAVAHTDSAIASIDSAADRMGVAFDRLANTFDHLAVTFDRASDSLAAVTSLASDARPAVENFAAITSEARGITADTRANIEGGWLTKRLLVGVAVLVAISLLHSIIAAWRIHRRVAGMHEDVRRHITREPPK